MRRCAGFGNGTIATVTVTGGTHALHLHVEQWCIHRFHHGGRRHLYRLHHRCERLRTGNGNSITINATGQPNAANAGPGPGGLLEQLSDRPARQRCQRHGGASGRAVNDPSRTLASAMQYMPSTAEVLAGGVTLTLTTTGNSTCPPVSDQVFIALSNSFLNAALSTTNVDCYNNGNGSIAFTPEVAGNSYLWNDALAQTTPTATKLGPAATPC